MKVTIEFRVDMEAWRAKYGSSYAAIDGEVIKYIADQIHMSTAAEDGLIWKISVHRDAS